MSDLKLFETDAELVVELHGSPVAIEKSPQKARPLIQTSHEAS